MPYGGAEQAINDVQRGVNSRRDAAGRRHRRVHLGGRRVEAPAQAQGKGIRGDRGSAPRLAAGRRFPRQFGSSVMTPMVFNTVVVYNITQVSYRQAICLPDLQGRMNSVMRFIVWNDPDRFTRGRRARKLDRATRDDRDRRDRWQHVIPLDPPFPAPPPPRDAGADRRRATNDRSRRGIPRGCRSALAGRRFLTRCGYGRTTDSGATRNS
jgi:hypothetical protein